MTAISNLREIVRYQKHMDLLDTEAKECLAQAVTAYRAEEDGEAYDLIGDMAERLQRQNIIVPELPEEEIWTLKQRYQL